MFVIARLFGLLAGFLRCLIVPVKPGPVAPSQIEYDGALPNITGLTVLFNSLSQNAAPVFGNFGLAIYAGITNTLLAKDIVQGFIRRAGAQTNSDLTDTATNIVGAIPGAQVGQTFWFNYINMSLGSASLAAGTGVSFVGTATVGPSSIRSFMGQVTGSSTVSLTNMFQFSNIVF